MILDSKRVPEEWREIVLVLIFGVASRILPEPFLVSYGDGQTDKWGQAMISMEDDVCR